MRSMTLLPLLLAAGCGDDSSPSDGQYDDTALLARIDALEATASAQAATIGDLEGQLTTLAGSCLVSSDLEGLASESWVEGQGYLVASDLPEYPSVEALEDLAATLSDQSLRLDGLESDYIALDDVSGDNQDRIVALEGRVGAIEGDYLASGDYAALEDAIGDNQDRIAALEDSDLFSEVSDLATYLEIDTEDHAVRFVGANVYVQSGSGATDGEPNGLGNLIVGYDEDYSEDDSTDDKSGSHNLVVGYGSTYTSYGGVLFGYNNAATGPFAGVLGGREGVASGDFATVSGGYRNEASGSQASVLGGYANLASGSSSSVVGGQYADASGSQAAILGGYENVASGTFATVSGGQGNEASASRAAVLGGYTNLASGSSSSVAGGQNNEASGSQAAILGGNDNTASGNFAAIVGGESNVASGTSEVLP